MKRVMGFAYHKSTQTALAYDVRIWLQNLRIADVFRPIHLSGSVRPWDFTTLWPGEGLIRCIFRAPHLNTEMGMMGKHDVLQYDVDGSVRMGMAMGYAQTTSQRFPYVAFIWPFEGLSPSTWRKQFATIAILDARAIVGPAPYFEEDGVITCLVHAA